MTINKKYFKIIVFISFISMLLNLISPSLNAFADTKSSTQNNGTIKVTAKFTDGNTVSDGMFKTLKVDYDILDLSHLNIGDKLVINLPDIFSNIIPKYSSKHFSDCDINGNTVTLTFNKDAAEGGLKGYFSLSLQTFDKIEDKTYTVVINAPGSSQTIYLEGHARHDTSDKATVSPIMYKGNFLNQDGNNVGIITNPTNVPYYVEINRPGHNEYGEITNKELHDASFVDNIPQGMQLNTNSVSITKNSWTGQFDYRDSPIFSANLDVTKELLNSQKLIVTPYSITLNLGYVPWYESYSIRYSTFVVSNEKKYSNTAKFYYKDTDPTKSKSVISTSDAKLVSDAGALNVHKYVNKKNINNDPEDQKIEYTISFDSDGNFDKGVISIIDSLDPRLSDIKIKEATSQFNTYFTTKVDKETGKEIKVLHVNNNNGAITPGNNAYIKIEASMKNVKPGETVSNTAYVNGNKTNTVVTKKNPEVKILKIDKNDTSKTPVCIGGAIFKLTTKDGKPVKDVYGKDQSTITSLANKELTLELPYGHYILTEIKAPNGYKLDQSPINFTVDDDTTTLQVIAKDSLLPSTCNLNIKKTDENGTPLLGAEFNLYKESDLTNPLKFANSNIKNNYELNNLGNITLSPIGSSASLLINKLPYGNYVLKESKAPNGYLLSDDIYITINSEESFYKIGVNGGKITLNKNSQKDSYVISVKDKPRIILPETGGNGPFKFYLIGILLLVSVLSLLSANKLILRKKEN